MAIIDRYMLQLNRQGLNYIYNYINPLIGSSNGELNDQDGKAIYVETIMQYTEYLDRGPTEYLEQLKNGFRTSGSNLNPDEASKLLNGYVELGLYIYTELNNLGFMKPDHYIYIPVIKDTYLVVELMRDQSCEGAN